MLKPFQCSETHLVPSHVSYVPAPAPPGSTRRLVRSAPRGMSRISGSRGPQTSRAHELAQQTSTNGCDMVGL